MYLYKMHWGSDSFHLLAYKDWHLTTVELSYNDHGYNEYTVITNRITYLFWFSMFYQKNFMVIAYNFSKFHGYNKYFCKNHKN